MCVAGHPVSQCIQGTAVSFDEDPEGFHLPVTDTSDDGGIAFLHLLIRRGHGGLVRRALCWVQLDPLVLFSVHLLYLCPSVVVRQDVAVLLAGAGTSDHAALAEADAVAVATTGDGRAGDMAVLVTLEVEREV